MQIVGTDSPAFYRAAAVIREHLPLTAFEPGAKVIYDDNNYYAVINTDGDGNLTYDHVCLNPMWMSPTHIFMALTTVFSLGSIINAFVAPENTRSARFLNGVGFKKTGTLRQVCGDWDIYSMTADEWQNNRIRRHFINTQKQTQDQ